MIKQKIKLSLLTGIILMSVTLPVGADSLWNDTSTATMFTDKRPAFVVGGLITILVDEKLQASQNATTSGNKKVQNQHKWEYPADGKQTTGQLKIDNQLQFDGKGSTSRTGAIVFAITAKIEDILPNGNLIVSARKKIRVNDEVSEIVLSGMVRRDDITPDNSIISSKIADIKVDVKGNGPVSAKTTGGLLSRIFNFLL